MNGEEGCHVCGDTRLYAFVSGVFEDPDVLLCKLCYEREVGE